MFPDYGQQYVYVLEYKLGNKLHKKKLKAKSGSDVAVAEASSLLQELDKSGQLGEFCLKLITVREERIEVSFSKKS